MEISKIFAEIIKQLRAIKTSQDEHGTGHTSNHYYMFIAKFDGPYVCICNKSGTTILYCIETEQEMKKFLASAKK